MELHVIEREGRETVVLLDNEMRIIKPVYDYLKFQRQRDKALNTLKASGSDLRTYWEFLNDSGYEYDKVTPKMISEFIDYLRASDDDVIAVKKDKMQLKDDKIATLRMQVKKLEEDKEKLIIQLVDYEELKSENERLKKQLAKK